MPSYEIFLKSSAIQDIDSLKKYDAARIVDSIEKFLKFQPTLESKSRIKKLRGITDPDYRLRIGNYRVFYTVDERERRIEILRLMHKNQTANYYKELE